MANSVEFIELIGDKEIEIGDGAATWETSLQAPRADEFERARSGRASSANLLDFGRLR